MMVYKVESVSYSSFYPVYSLVPRDYTGHSLPIMCSMASVISLLGNHYVGSGVTHQKTGCQV
jgi:hypothetical protein